MLKLDAGVDRNGVPFVSARQLEDFASDVLDDYDERGTLTKYPQPLNIELFAEQYLEAILEVRSITMDRSILGVTIFNGHCVPVYDMMKGTLVGLDVKPRTILVEQGIYNRLDPGRYNFTVAHEAAGHLCCHADVSINTGALCHQAEGGVVFMCRPENAEYIAASTRTPEDWLEWQADYMAAAVLMPSATVPMAIDRAMRDASELGGECGRRKMQTNLQLQRYLIEYIARVYQVSFTAAKLRLKHLGFFNVHFSRG